MNVNIITKPVTRKIYTYAKETNVSKFTAKQHDAYLAKLGELMRVPMSASEVITKCTIHDNPARITLSIVDTGSYREQIAVTSKNIKGLVAAVQLAVRTGIPLAMELNKWVNKWGAEKVTEDEAYYAEYNAQAAVVTILRYVK